MQLLGEEPMASQSNLSDKNYLRLFCNGHPVDIIYGYLLPATDNLNDLSNNLRNSKHSTFRTRKMRESQEDRGVFAGTACRFYSNNL